MSSGDPEAARREEREREAGEVTRPAGRTGRCEALELDYEKTLEYLHHLADIRFKLLGALPLVTGAALGLVQPGFASLNALLIGLLGFFASVGILFYDRRNTDIYDTHIRRAKLLEYELDMPSLSATQGWGGPFMNREAKGRRLFGRIEVYHDNGLRIIYAAVLGGWAYLASAGAFGLLPDATAMAQAGFGLSLGLFVAIGAWIQMNRWGARTPRQKKMDEEIEQRYAPTPAARWERSVVSDAD